MELDRNAERSIYKQIYDILLLEIKEGLYNGSGTLPSEKELCQRFSVERNTLRKALKMLVDEKLVSKRPGYGTVLTTIGTSDIPDAPSILRNILLITQEDYLVQHGEYFHFKLINSFEKRLSEIGYNLIFKSIGRGNDLDEIIRNTSPAAIIYDSFMQDEMYHKGLRADIACISVNHYSPLMTSVVSNNFDGAYRVTKMLSEAGHSKIAVITGKRNYQTNIERLSGIQSFYQKKGYELDSKYIYNGDWLFSSGAAAGERILNMPEAERPTAVFAFNDDMAYGCYSCFERSGVKIPNDISIVGFDRSDRYKSIFPPITTVDVNIDAMIEYSCWYLSGYLSGGAPRVCAKIQIDTAFIDNGTVRKL